jgi:hypothetical protein
MNRSQKSDDDSFSTFLENMQAPSPKPDTPSAAGTSSGPLSTIVAVLAEQGPQTVPDLILKSRLPAGVLVQALVTMNATGLATVRAQPSSGLEVVELTEAGGALVPLLRFA